MSLSIQLLRSARCLRKPVNTQVALKEMSTTKSRYAASSFSSLQLQQHKIGTTIQKRNISDEKPYASAAFATVEPTEEELQPVRIVPGKIELKHQESEKVVSITVRIPESHRDEFIFYSGQYVDLGRLKGGKLENIRTSNSLFSQFSAASSPQELAENGTIRFTIKKTSHPFSQWLFRASNIGDDLLLQGGRGDFYYSKKRFPDAKNIVLIGGGLGFTPLVSILRHIYQAEPDVNVVYIHSARTPGEFLFKEEIEKMTQERQNIRAVWKLTEREIVTETAENGLEEKKEILKRIDVPFLESLNLDIENSVFFVCGPRGMVHIVQSMLSKLGVDKLKVHDK